ncbi:MAG: DUF362 domain-containing protein [Oligoflexia bacterium]|nr:DUF362 domain-containing protein [Oligoflexia bacterium]
MLAKTAVGITIVILKFFTAPAAAATAAAAAAIAATAISTSYPDLVAVKGGSPVEMFERGINELGGMQRFVKKGTVVLVKPNIGWNKTPTQGANTNPELVGAIVKKAYEVGAKKVWVFDHPVDEEKACYKNSGIEAAVIQNGGIMHTANNESDYVEREIPRAKFLKKVKVHKLYLESDVIINVPILKNHAGSKMTAAMKNLMGVVWDRRTWHEQGLHQCIAEFTLLKKVDLTIVDAYMVMMANGPRGFSTEDLKPARMQLLSTDMLLVDTAGAAILETAVNKIPSIEIAQKLGVGSSDLKKANIKRIDMAAAAANVNSKVSL